MKLIIPMAGRGSRLRPHTLTIPKPLLPIAGKPMVQRLVEDIAASLPLPLSEIAFIVGDFGEAVENRLRQIVSAMGIPCKIYQQDQPLGVGHAIYCAKDSLEGPCMIAFSDTLFNASFAFDPQQDGIIWVKQVTDPSAFGVVKLNEGGLITDFIEKSPVFVSDLAIVGIYYIQDAKTLKSALHYLLEHDVKDKGEYQLTSALERMRENGTGFRAAYIDEWLDCGNKDNVISTNSRMLDIKQSTEVLIHESAEIINSVIIPPCSIAEGAVIRNSVVGPYVSVGNHSELHRSVVSNTIIQNETIVYNANFINSLLGNSVDYAGKASEISLGDYSKT